MHGIRRWKKSGVLLSLMASMCFAATLCAAADGTGDTNAAAGLYLKVTLASPVKMSKLKPGDVIEGHLARDVYSADHKALSAGSNARLTVDHLEKRKRQRNDHWPWVVNAFTPRHESYPIFKTATVTEGGAEVSLNVSVISESRMRDVHALAKKAKPGEPPAANHGEVDVSKSNQMKAPTPTLILEATGMESVPASTTGESAVDENPAAAETLPVGTQCKILLLGSVSASKSKPGDVVQARLLEPVMLNSKVILPAGSMFEGKVVKKTPPRWLSRAGSLYLTFTDLTLPEGRHVSIAASLAGAELDARSHTKIDAEGQLHGEHPGKAWMAINLGVTAGIAKEADDTIQLIIEAIVSTATDASTAGTGRIVAGCASGLFMITRHGRDVTLPRFTEMAISLDRPISLNTMAETEAAGAMAGGK
ncbi:MAG TPA: hypothetical protein VMH04_08280 [Candidatus Solibacter sp.]|nr:hypothetical protein [Candidatus Solibacter sp.]